MRSFLKNFPFMVLSSLRLGTLCLCYTALSDPDMAALLWEWRSHVGPMLFYLMTREIIGVMKRGAAS